ncbi:BolA family transcriptional regulator [Amylibacter kogurei]|uniref:BolA family transcriptional regulator n=2 Tax=Paramylibacter kogurei TaxID=1889778 RepID=A0A2G5K7G9_9RHOB|nr:BolA family protein [Amylibacter kogurei]PIB25069.1 BolA family transcriptional regulator [Amylibacter kogurei]
MSMLEQIRSKLDAAFVPKVLEVRDDSEDHRGHAGYREGGNTHFSVKIRAAAFDGQSRVAQQRAIYAQLKQEFADGLHALALDVGGADAP